MSKKLDLSGFSYLAKARVLKIDKYPKPNYGAEVREVIDTLAADAPMVVVAASHLGLKTGLITNSIGANSEGDEVVSYFKRNQVRFSFTRNQEIKTPFITVLSDNAGDRKWFPYIPNAVSELEQANFNLIAQSSIAYIDFYEIIRKPAQKAVEFANRNKTPCFINLGGSPFTPEVSRFLKGKDIAIVQTNLDEAEVDNAPLLAQNIFSEIKPKVAIVTLGSKGAVACTLEGVVSIPAYKVNVKHLHGAGAAFSAGYAYCYLKGLDVDESLRFACALGSLNCSVERGFDAFSLENVESFIKSQEG